jgi:hypothetical protein
MVGRRMRPQFRVEHERPGVMTASDPIERPPRLPRRSADGPTSQVRNTVTTVLITIIKHAEEPASEAPENADASVRRLANFDRPIMNRRPVRSTSPREWKRPFEPAPALARALEQDKELNACPSTHVELAHVAQKELVLARFRGAIREKPATNVVKVPENRCSENLL